MFIHFLLLQQNIWDWVNDEQWKFLCLKALEIGQGRKGQLSDTDLLVSYLMNFLCFHLPSMTSLAIWNTMTWKSSWNNGSLPLTTSWLQHKLLENLACLPAPPCGFRVWNENRNRTQHWSLGVILASSPPMTSPLFHSRMSECIFQKDSHNSVRRQSCWVIAQRRARRQDIQPSVFPVPQGLIPHS